MYRFSLSVMSTRSTSVRLQLLSQECGSDYHIAVHYAHVYHWVIDSYLLVDREAETSIKYFALHLFTVPSVASHIKHDHQLISRLSRSSPHFSPTRLETSASSFHPTHASGSTSMRILSSQSDLCLSSVTCGTSRITEACRSS